MKERSLILVVEDDANVASYLRRSLAYEGYRVVVSSTAEEALEHLAREQPSLLLLDLMLPGMDGLGLVQKLRGEGWSLPILMLTARESVPDRVAGLQAGADDYLGKPFALEELLARIEALLRRHDVPTEGHTLTFNELSLDERAYTVRRGERTLALTAREFELLAYFMRHPRQVLTRDQLYEQLWGPDVDSSSKVLDVFVGHLRAKMEADGEPRLIQTVRGIGYVLREE